MDTFSMSFHILQALQILKNSLGGMPGLSVGAAYQAPPLGGAEAAATNDIVYLTASCYSTIFDDLPSKDFLQAITRSTSKSTL
jgi:hypothetical protein